jgi:hypothetical protein
LQDEQNKHRQANLATHWRAFNNDTATQHLTNASAFVLNASVSLQVSFLVLSFQANKVEQMREQEDRVGFFVRYS